MGDDGALTGIIPSADWGHRFGPVCDCLLYELPYRIYLYTADDRLLISSIDYFERYIKYLEKQIETSYDFTLGDWMGYGNSDRSPKDFVIEFYYLKGLKITALAHSLAKTGNTLYQTKYEEKKREFLGKYLDSHGKCTVSEQTAIAMLLSTDLHKDCAPLAEQLVSTVLRDGIRLTSGMVGIQYLYDALSLANRADLAYKLIVESEPGYKTWYLHGATTLWERWDGEDDCSHNHHMYSGVIAWFYKSLLGIAPSPNAPGFVEIDLKPSFIKEIKFARANVSTVRGMIYANWEFKDNAIVYTVNIPKGIRASFRGKELAVGENSFIIENKIEV